MSSRGESASAACRAGELVAAARDDPARRIRLAVQFYERRLAGRSIRPYRRAEIAFMRWQIQRGPLAPPGAAAPGSPWWRAVNESLLRDAVEADLLFSGASGEASTTAVLYWTVFLRRPTPEAWYRAHNASILAGYPNNRDLVELETPLERFFMDVALLRVLYAHSLRARNAPDVAKLLVRSGSLSPYSASVFSASVLSGRSRKGD